MQNDHFGEQQYTGDTPTEIMEPKTHYIEEDVFYARYRRKKMALVCSAAVMIAVIAVAVILFLIMQQKQAAFTEHMVMADKYYASNNYDAAVMAYKLTIQDKPRDAAAYIKLAGVYMAMGDYSSARDILAEGYRATGSEEILRKMQNMYVQEGVTAADMTQEEMEEASAEITINNTVFDWIADLDYSGYVRQFGSATVQDAGNGVLNLSFNGFAGKCVYFNISGNGFIVDTARNLPYANRKPNYVELTGLGCIFNGYAGVLTYPRIQEVFGNGGTIGYREDLQQYTIKLEYRNCILEIACDENGNITGAAPWNQVCAKYEGEIEADTMVENAGRHSGYITNAVTGGGVRARVTAHEQNRYGEAVATVECGYDGSYSLELSEGMYVLEITAEGFITEYFDVNIRSGDQRTAMNYVISPELSAGEIRIVLEWGSYPADLDSHLTGRTSSGSRIEVAYNAKQAVEGGNVVAELDIDDTNGYGPETTTIYDFNGTYEFRVHDFSNNGDSNSSALSGSQAVVKVYLPGETQPRVFNVPGGTGVWWNVFRIENGQILEVNRIE